MTKYCERVYSATVLDPQRLSLNAKEMKADMYMKMFDESTDMNHDCKVSARRQEADLSNVSLNNSHFLLFSSFSSFKYLMTSVTIHFSKD